MNCKLLGKIGLFSGLSSSDRHILVELFSNESASAGEIILKEGVIGSKFYILIHGTVRAYSKTVLVGEYGQVIFRSVF